MTEFIGFNDIHHITGDNSGLETQLLEIAQSGSGTALEQIKDPLFQGTYECQTYALINGILSVSNNNYFQNQNIRNFVQRMRKKAKKEKSTEGSESIMTQVDAYFSDEGIPLHPISSTVNPIHLTSKLFREHRFLGMSNGKERHATTLIPIKNPSREHVGVILDSNKGRSNISISDYATILTNYFDKYYDHYRIYEVK
jgi:hypothetical protein